MPSPLHPEDSASTESLAESLRSWEGSVRALRDLCARQEDAIRNVSGNGDLDALLSAKDRAYESADAAASRYRGLVETTGSRAGSSEEGLLAGIAALLADIAGYEREAACLLQSEMRRVGSEIVTLRRGRDAAAAFERLEDVPRFLDSRT